MLLVELFADTLVPIIPKSSGAYRLIVDLWLDQQILAGNWAAIGG